MIGRAKDSDIVLNDRRASRKHAQIAGDAAGFRILDGHFENGAMVPSVNHVFVNGEPIADKPLVRGDVITIGESRLEYRETPVAVPLAAGKPAVITSPTVGQNAAT